ncbi:hypothetical protein MIR68_011034 [Amoeboaphelidium protococcarum]|nr:hypothetical protein MIR68_011034 [Amoeboaphelidium protococcarum]
MKSTLIAVTLLAAAARAVPTYPAYDQGDQGFNDDSDLQYGAPQQNQQFAGNYQPTPPNSFNERRSQSYDQLQQYGAAQPEEQQQYANSPLARNSYDDAYPQNYQRQQSAPRQHSNGGLAYKHPSLPRNFVPPPQQQQQQQQQQLQQQYSSVPPSNSAPAQQYQQQQAVTQDPYDAAEQSESDNFKFEDPQQQTPAPQQGSQAGQVAVAGGAAAGAATVTGASAGTGSAPVQQSPQQEGSSDFDEAFKTVCPGLFGKTKMQIVTAISKAGSIFAACKSDADVQKPQQPAAGASATTEQRFAEPAAQQSAPSSGSQAPQEPAKKGFLANLFKW